VERKGRLAPAEAIVPAPENPALSWFSELVAFLLQEHGLNSPDDIKTHAEVAAPPGRKQDPFGYPFNHFFSLVENNRQFTWSAKAI